MSVIAELTYTDAILEEKLRSLLGKARITIVLSSDPMSVPNIGTATRIFWRGSM
jgi:hypothetical protein